MVHHGCIVLNLIILIVFLTLLTRFGLNTNDLILKLRNADLALIIAGEETFFDAVSGFCLLTERMT
jgi:hypothetical protein